MVHVGNVESSCECCSWAMGLFNNCALACISWVIFKLKKFYLSSLSKFFLYPSHWDVLLVITKTNIHQPIKRAKKKRVQGLFAYQCQKKLLKCLAKDWLLECVRPILRLDINYWRHKKWKWEAISLKRWNKQLSKKWWWNKTWLIFHFWMLHTY